MTNPTKQVKHEIEYHFTSKAFKEHNKEMRDEGKKESEDLYDRLYEEGKLGSRIADRKIKEALEDELKFLKDLDYLMPSSKEEIRCMRITEIKQKLEKLK